MKNLFLFAVTVLSLSLASCSSKPAEVTEVCVDSTVVVVDTAAVTPVADTAVAK